MTNIDKHPAGTFCWIELHTTDQAAAKTFYGSLLVGRRTNNRWPCDYYTGIQTFRATKRPPPCTAASRWEYRRHHLLIG